MGVKKKLWVLTLLLAVTAASAQDDKLTGTIITYRDNQPSAAFAFDGDPETYVQMSTGSRAWFGLDLGTPHVITSVGWMPRSNYAYGTKYCQLGLFEGANDPTFIDAVPLFLIEDGGVGGVMSRAEVHVSRGFRYVRYTGPAYSRSTVAELEFRGHEGEGDDAQFYQVTNLPTFSMRTVSGNDPTSKTYEEEAQMTLVYDDGTGIQEYPILARCRGNASFGFEKKPYRIRFNDGKSHRLMRGSVLESPAKAKKWTLINNYGDKTLMRNIVAFETSRRFGMEYTVWCQAVDVIVNGEYKGCYQLCDQITADKNRVPIIEMTPEDIEGEALTGGYLVEIDAYAGSEPSMFYSARGLPVTIKEPGASSITDEQHQYIKGFFNSLEATIWSGSFAHPATGYRSRMDLDSFLRHFLVGEYSGNTDTYWSVYLWKERGDDIFHVGPSWDFDLAYNNDQRTYPVENHTDWIYCSGGSGAGNMISVVNRILSDPAAYARLCEIWAECRDNGSMTPESMTAFVDSIADRLYESQKLNFMRWPILGVRVHQNAFAYPTYEEEVDVVRRCVEERFTFMDRKLRYGEDPEDPIDPDTIPSDGDFIIKSAPDLVNFSIAVNSGKTRLHGILENDIDMIVKSRDFQPIGTQENKYGGTFDGNGHTIRNLRIDKQSERYVGLFGVVDEGAIIRNFVLDETCKIQGGAYVGLIGGSICKGNIFMSCLGNEGTVTAAGQNAGGIIGCNMNSSATFEFENCYVTGTVTGGNESAALTGWLGNNATVINCWSLANVTGTEGDKTFYRGTAAILNCYDIGNPAYGLWKLTREMAESGELCWLLENAGFGTGVWYQNLGEEDADSHPVLNKSHGIVERRGDGIYGNMDTAISNRTFVDADDVPYYDLRGRIVSPDALTPGIYIHNGKKVIIK
jgi:hypothetical protein